jgi:hypothetical protein
MILKLQTMKKMIFALGLIGLIGAGANAQTIGNSANSKVAKNYPVCQTSTGYRVCNDAAATMPATTPAKGANLTGITSSSVHMGSGMSMETPRSYGGNRRKVSHIFVTYDDPQAPYKGKESMVNDGVQKNIVRNINYYDQSVILPPVDGGKGNMGR